MRTLATIGFTFFAGALAAAYLPAGDWHWYVAAVLFAAGVVFLLTRKRWKYGARACIMALSLAAALAYFAAYQLLVQQPVLDLCGQETAFSGTVTAYPVESTYGAKVTIRLDGFHGAKAVYYGDSELLRLEPGDRLSGTALWNDASVINDTELTTFTAKGVYALLYDRDNVTAESGTRGDIRWWPQRLCRAFGQKIAAIWDDSRVSAFVTAELTGDKSGISDEDYAAAKGAGLSHLFAVSGMHCAFLVTLLSLLLPRHKRRLHCAVTMGVLLVYMCMVGLTPSVVRACILQIFMLLAPLFKRDADPLTAMGAALMVILLCNPFAAASVSLQLSFAAALGLVLVSGKLYKAFTRWYHGQRKWAKRTIAFFAASLSATLGAMVFTTPLAAYYFNILSLVSPLAGLVALPLATYSFMASFVTVLCGFIWLPAARILGFVTYALIHAVLWLAHTMTRWPYHAVYFNNVYLRIWLAGSYGAFGLCYLMRRWRKRKYIITAAVVVLTMVLAIALHAGQYHHSALGVTALDVGQGESVALYSGDTAMLVDCGSSNSFVDAGTYAADALESMGFHHLQAVAVTHYHADHTNGLYTLLSRLQVDTLYLPDVEDEYGVRERLIDLAEEYGTQVVMITDMLSVPLGEAQCLIFPPVSAGDLNEQCLSVLTTADRFDVLVTGDMTASAECALVEEYSVPDIEVLLVSHHGSKYSSNEVFLRAVLPETAIISVGDNSYGHPTQEAIDRLEQVGARVRRTDEEGDVTVIWGELNGER